MSIKELKDIVKNSDNKKLEPLKNLFNFMDYFDEDYEKENDGKKNPYSLDSMGEIDYGKEM